MNTGADRPAIAEDSIRNVYSRCPFRIDAFDGDEQLARATAFFVNYDEDWFIITNGHVVSGLHAFTGQAMDGVFKDRYPRRLRLHLPEHTDLGDRDWYKPNVFSYDLYSDGLPKWYVHPTLRHRCDVATIEVAWPREQVRLWHPAINRIC